MTSVTVHQITPQHPSQAYLNVFTKEGSVSVWTYLNGKTPVYLLVRSNGYVEFIAFSDEDYEKEYMEENSDKFSEIIRIG